MYTIDLQLQEQSLSLLIASGVESTVFVGRKNVANDSDTLLWCINKRKDFGELYLYIVTHHRLDTAKLVINLWANEIILNM